MHQLTNRELKWLLVVVAILAAAGILEMFSQMIGR